MLPSDPMILLSWVNTQLRDRSLPLTELCAELDAAEEDLKAKLEAAGFRFDAEQNRFR